VDNKSGRRWQDIAAELANEFDQERVLKLSVELNEALGREARVFKTPRKENPRMQSLFLFES